MTNTVDSAPEENMPVENVLEEKMPEKNMPGTSHDITIRQAVADDASALTAIALEAKSYWGYPARWIENWRNQLTIDTETIALSQVFVAELDGTPVAFYALSGTGPLLTLDHLWVLPRAMGNGIGRRLVEHAIQVAADDGAERIEIESDPNAEEFYRRMGARCIGQVSYELDHETRFLPLMQIRLIDML